MMANCGILPFVPGGKKVRFFCRLTGTNASQDGATGLQGLLRPPSGVASSQSLPLRLLLIPPKNPESLQARAPAMSGYLACNPPRSPALRSMLMLPSERRDHCHPMQSTAPSVSPLALVADDSPCKSYRALLRDSYGPSPAFPLSVPPIRIVPWPSSG
jgi:hypothetical protein